MNVYVLLCLAAVAVVGLIEWVKNLVEKFLTVPGFSGVRIHSGNTAEDTEGCILLRVRFWTAGKLSKSSLRY